MLAARALAVPDCTTPLTTTAAEAEAAVNAVEGVLAELPVVGGLVPDITLEMFADAREATGRDGPYWVAEAHVTAVEFDLPTLELGTLAHGLLDDLANASLSDLLGALDSSLATDAGDPAFAALEGVSTQLDTALETVRAAVATVVDAETTLSELLADLPASDALDGLRTPGLNITVDPTSRAEFRSAATTDEGRDGGTPGDGGSPGGGTPGPDGAPDEPARELPTTGGGLALLGVLVVGGAVLLRRRR